MVKSHVTSITRPPHAALLSFGVGCSSLAMSDALRQLLAKHAAQIYIRRSVEQQHVVDFGSILEKHSPGKPGKSAEADVRYLCRIAQSNTGEHRSLNPTVRLMRHFAMDVHATSAFILQPTACYNDMAHLCRLVRPS